MIASPGPPAIATTLPDAQVQNAWKAAQDFEAMTLSQFLAPMFDTVDQSSGAFGGGSGEAQWKPMLIDAMAKNIAHAGGLGLAQPVFRQMLELQEGRSRT